MTTQDFVAEAREIAIEYLKEWKCTAKCDSEGRVQIDVFPDPVVLRIEALPDLSGTCSTPVLYLDLIVVGPGPHVAEQKTLARTEAAPQKDDIVRAIEYLMWNASESNEPDLESSCPENAPHTYCEGGEDSDVHFVVMGCNWVCANCQLLPKDEYVFRCDTIEEAIAHIEAHRDAGHKFDFIDVLAQLSEELEEMANDELGTQES
jgi:hypothetical protein